MAAFIQKLFRKRSATGGPGTTARGKHKGAVQGSSRQSGAAPAGGQDSSQQDAQAAALQNQQRIDQQRAALGGELDQATLADLATDGLAADIRLDAARALTDKELLQKVQKQVKGRDKGVYQVVRQSLQALRELEEAEQQVCESIRQVIQQAADLARTGDTTLYEARLVNLERQWSDVAPRADNEQTVQALDNLRQCRQRAKELTEQKQTEAFHNEQAQQRQQTLTLLEETLQGLQARPSDSAALPSLDALLRTQENRWLEATRDTQVDKGEQKQYEALMQPLRALLSALRQLQEISQGTDIATTEVLSQLTWPQGFPKPEILIAAGKQAREQAVEPEQRSDTGGQARIGVAEFEARLDELEQSLENSQLKESRQLYRRAQEAHRHLDRHAVQQTRARLQRLAGRLRELEDWQGFATTPKQQTLCEQMEYLAEQPMEPEAKAARIQELQQEWRELGGSSDRTLWNRFKAASDKAFEPCKAYFEARSDLKQVHLQTRLTLCEQLRTFIDSVSWEAPDWRLVERAARAAREDWRKAWPVDFRQNRQVQKQFDQLMAELEERLDAERDRNEALKSDIVVRAEALIDQQPLAAAMSTAKALQQEWQQVGITRHKEDRRLWKAFRAACDQIFDRRQEERQQHQALETAADQRALEIIREAGDAASGSDAALIEAIMTRLQAADDGVSGKVRKSLEDALRQLRHAQQGLAAQRQHEDWQQRINERRQGPLPAARIPEHWPGLAADSQARSITELVVLAEILTGRPSPDEHQALRMELQVRRLSQGLGQGESSDSSMESLVAQWCVGLEDDARPDSLESRLIATLSPTS